MNLFEQLRNDIISSDISLSIALRKAKVLASLLRNENFKKWVDNELNGYSDNSELPPYRKISTVNFGTFSGSFGRAMNNVAVPLYKMSESFQETFKNLNFDNGIRELESLVSGDNATLVRRWPAEAIALWNMECSDESDFALIGAYSQIAKSNVEAIIDTTRNKLLDFILELQEINPEILNSEKAISDLPEEKVHNSFNYTIYGNNNVVASGHAVTQTITQSVSANDKNSLLKYFEKLGIEAEDLNELDSAIDQDGNPKKSEFGNQVKSWIGKMTVKAVQGAWKIALDAAPKLLTEGLSNYYGW